MRIKILTIFPEMFPGALSMSLAGKAMEKNLWSMEIIDIKEFGDSKYHKVDDVTYGGGNGMVMLPEVLGRAIDHAKSDMISPVIFYLSPKGPTLQQSIAKEIASFSEIIFICARYEGVDERVIDEYNVNLISVGDYILSGGELAAMIVIDAALRLLPGVISNESTLLEESFNYVENQGNLLEYPQYTRPSVWRGREVPSVLLSGNHKNIEKWRLEQSIEITRKLRPDLMKHK